MRLGQVVKRLPLAQPLRHTLRQLLLPIYRQAQNQRKLALSTRRATISVWAKMSATAS
jgi:hypothetical protein